MKSIYDILTNPWPLKATGLVLGLILVLGHLFALFQAQKVQSQLKAFPRHRFAGGAILAIVVLWSWILMRYQDLGEFFVWRDKILLILPILGVLIYLYVDEFLSVRALGCFLLLLASPILKSAFMQDPTTRLLLPILAYAWIILSLFWIGMPWLLRDQIQWVSANPLRWKTVCVSGAVYGALMMACAVLFY